MLFACSLAGHAVGGANTPQEVSPVKGYAEGTAHHHRNHSNALRTMLHHVRPDSPPDRLQL